MNVYIRGLTDADIQSLKQQAKSLGVTYQSFVRLLLIEQARDQSKTSVVIKRQPKVLV